MTGCAAILARDGALSSTLAMVGAPARSLPIRRQADLHQSRHLPFTVNLVAMTRAQWEPAVVVEPLIADPRRVV